MILGSDTRARRDLARPLKGTVKDRLSSDMDALAMTEAASISKRGARCHEKSAADQTRCRPPDLIGGPPIRGHLREGGIGSSLRLHRISAPRAVAWGGQVRNVVIPLMRAARFRTGERNTDMSQSSLRREHRGRAASVACAARRSRCQPLDLTQGGWHPFKIEGHMSFALWLGEGAGTRPSAP